MLDLTSIFRHARETCGFPDLKKDTAGPNHSHWNSLFTVPNKLQTVVLTYFHGPLSPVFSLIGHLWSAAKSSPKTWVTSKVFKDALSASSPGQVSYSPEWTEFGQLPNVFLRALLAFFWDCGDMLWHSGFWCPRSKLAIKNGLWLISRDGNANEGNAGICWVSGGTWGLMSLGLRLYIDTPKWWYGVHEQNAMVWWMTNNDKHNNTNAYIYNILYNLQQKHELHISLLVQLYNVSKLHMASKKVIAYGIRQTELK